MEKAKIISEEPVYAEVSVKGFLHGERVIATVSTKYTPLWRVVCIGANEAWVAGERGTITRIDIHGVIQNTVGVNIRNVWADTISVTKNEEVLYSNVDEGTVNILRYEKPRHLITIEREWRPIEYAARFQEIFYFTLLVINIIIKLSDITDEDQHRKFLWMHMNLWERSVPS